MSVCKVIDKKDEVVFFEITSPELKVICTNLGCHVLSIFSKDRNGEFGDVILGYKDVIKDCNDGSCLGAVVGRVANRIGGGAFMLNGKEYKLATNNGPNTLHGGLVGFNQKVFDYEMIEDGVCFTYVSPDMEEGFPGTLELKVSYRVMDDTLVISYEASSDQDTVINFTNHAYFNLSAHPGTIYDHELKIDADHINCVDETCLAYGPLYDVEGTPFDFRDFHKIGERIHEDNEQLKNGNGYDHNFILNSDKDQIILKDHESGRVLTISTKMPCVQVYSGNFLAGDTVGKGDVFYENRGGVAIETQMMPNAIHIQKEPETILKAGDQFTSETCYRFHHE